MEDFDVRGKELSFHMLLGGLELVSYFPRG